MNREKLPAFISDPADKLVPYAVEDKKNFYEHADMPDKLLRIDTHEYILHTALPYFKRFLQDIEDHFRIPTVHPQFIVGAKPFPPHAQKLGYKPDIDVVAIMDKVDGISAENLLQQETLDESVVQEFDMLSQRMVAHLRDTYEQGGFHCQDFYHYSQFMFDESRATGQKLVLVDVEPLGFYFQYPPEQRMPGSIPIEIVEALSDIALDIIALEKKTGGQLAAGSEVIDFIEAIEAKGFASMEEAKQRIVRALESQDSTFLEVFNGLDGGIFSDDWQYNSSDYVERILARDGNI